MALIKSISGIRGTIGGKPGDSLTPIDVVKFASAYGTWLRRRGKGPLKVVTGRDARVSGEMVSTLVSASLRSVGIDVIDTGLATTPTVEMAVTGLNAGGGIIMTASHNPAQWNALKLLNEAVSSLAMPTAGRCLHWQPRKISTMSHMTCWAKRLLTTAGQRGT